MYKNMFIIGAGGFGREVLSMARDLEHNQTDWKIKGFIDDNIRALDNLETGGYYVLDTIKEHLINNNNVYVCAIADVTTKREICSYFVNLGAEFINLIHPTSKIGYTAKIGKGIIMAPYSGISENVTIGDFVTINAYSGFGHDAIVGDFCTISAHCDVMGHAVLGEGVFLGSHASICPEMVVEEYARVGAGSVVLKKVKTHTTVFGNPAKKIF